MESEDYSKFIELNNKLSRDIHAKCYDNLDKDFQDYKNLCITMFKDYLDLKNGN